MWSYFFTISVIHRHGHLVSNLRSSESSSSLRRVASPVSSPSGSIGVEYGGASGIGANCRVIPRDKHHQTSGIYASSNGAPLSSRVSSAGTSEQYHHGSGINAVSAAHGTSAVSAHPNQKLRSMNNLDPKGQQSSSGRSKGMMGKLNYFFKGTIPPLHNIYNTNGKS